MVEIQRSKGIDARIGDVQDLPFGRGEFDVVRVRTHSTVFVAENPA